PDTPLTNPGTKHAGNLVLLVNSLRGGSGDTRVFRDEVLHAARPSHSSHHSVPAVKSRAAQLRLALPATLLTSARRNTPIRPLIESARLSPLEFVQTLGNLYRRANATRTALEVPYNRFRALLIRRLGLRNDVSSTELLESARKKLGYRDPDFEKTLKQVLE